MWKIRKIGMIEQKIVSRWEDEPRCQTYRVEVEAYLFGEKCGSPV